MTSKVQPQCPVVVIVLMGVAGAGKTTVGRALAAALGWTFRDADELHASEAIDRMHRGEALGDEDRWPWLQRIRRVIDGALASGTPMVVACSALRERYRTFLAAADADSMRFVYLHADPELLAERLATRSGHFATASLLDTQLSTLAPPRDALTVDAGTSVPRLVSLIRERLNL